MSEAIIAYYIITNDSFGGDDEVHFGPSSLDFHDPPHALLLAILLLLCSPVLKNSRAYP